MRIRLKRNSKLLQLPGIGMTVINTILGTIWAAISSILHLRKKKQIKQPVIAHKDDFLVNFYGSLNFGQDIQVERFPILVPLPTDLESQWLAAIMRMKIGFIVLNIFGKLYRHPQECVLWTKHII